MREAVRRSDLSREEISDRMREIAKMDGLGGGRGSTISLSNLDAWVSETKCNLIPANLLPVFCRVTNDITPLEILGAPLGARLIDAQDDRILEWAKAELQSRQLARRKRKILSEIGGDSE